MKSKKMGTTKTFSKFLGLIAISGVILACSGCGRAEYERRLENRIASLRRESKFNELYAPQQVPDTPVSVRLPQVFKDPPLVPGGQINGQPIDERRLTPTLFPLPWLKLTYEAFIDEGGVRRPYYCYIAVADMNTLPVKDPAGMILTALKSKPEFDIKEWTEFNSETPEGRGAAWKKLRFVATQEFVNIKGGQEEYVRKPGVFEAYLREEGNWCILIAWRFEAELEAAVNVEKWAPLVTGCTTVKK